MSPRGRFAGAPRLRESAQIRGPARNASRLCRRVPNHRRPPGAHLRRPPRPGHGRKSQDGELDRVLFRQGESNAEENVSPARCGWAAERKTRVDPPQRAELGGGRRRFEVLVRGAVLALGERRALAGLALAGRRAAAGDPAVERTRLDLRLDELDRGTDPLGHGPGDLRLLRDGEVTADVLEECLVGAGEVARILGEPLDAVLACCEDVTAVLELLLDADIRVDQVFDAAIYGSRVLIHTRRKLFSPSVIELT